MLVGPEYFRLITKFIVFQLMTVNLVLFGEGVRIHTQHDFCDHGAHVHVHVCDMLMMCAGPIGKALYKLLVIQAFRADRLIAMASIFVATVLGEAFTHSAEQELNLAEIVTNEVHILSVCFLHAWDIVSR